LVKELEDAIEKYNVGDIEGSLYDLLRLDSEHPGTSPILGLIGRAYYEIGNYAYAANYFLESVKLSPKVELASLGLFHSYIKLHKRAEAFEEMNRFLTVSSSAEYERTKREMGVAQP
jgi:tetratricopeptide (TPR) repeat protein